MEDPLVHGSCLERIGDVAIHNHKSPELIKPRLFLDLAFSSIVNLVSNQDSDTRYLPWRRISQ